MGVPKGRSLPFPRLQEAACVGLTCLLLRKSQWGPRMFGEGEFDSYGGLELLCASAQATEAGSSPEVELTPAAHHSATVTQDAEQTGDQAAAAVQAQAVEGDKDEDGWPDKVKLDPLKLAGARKITKSNPGQAKDKKKLTGYKLAKEKPSKMELWQAIMERNPN